MLYVSVRIFPNGKGQSDRVDLDWRAGQELVIHYWFFSFGMSECWRKSFGRGKTTRKVCNMVSIYFSNAVTFLKIKVMSSSFSKDATTRCYTQVGWPFMKRTRFVCFYIEIFYVPTIFWVEAVNGSIKKMLLNNTERIEKFADALAFLISIDPTVTNDINRTIIT